MTAAFVMDDLARYLTVKRGLSKNTVRLVTSRYNIFFKFLTTGSFLLNSDAVERFLYSLKQKNLRNNSVNSYILMFKELQGYYEDRKIPHENFANNLTMLDKNSRPIEILTPIEIEKIINCRVPYGRFRSFSSEQTTEEQNNLYRTFTRFLAYTGARFSEAAGLTMQYVDLFTGKATFVDTKNKSNRSVWITEPLIGEIQQKMNGKNRQDLVFTNIIGSPVIPQNYGLHLKRASKIVGISKRVHPHIFRHSFATQLLMSGVDVTMVASILGHKDIQTTYQNYVHLADETLKKSIQRHPLIRRHIDPVEIIRTIKDTIASLHLESDSRFAYSIDENQSGFGFQVKIR